MAQELGRLTRPQASQYQGRRKLLLVPLLYGPPSDSKDALAILQTYWDQMQTQVASLESALGGLTHIYHESLTQGGDDGLKQLEVRDQRSHGFIQSKCVKGATLEATESGDLLAETLDLQRCLMMPLASEKVTLQLQEWFANSNRERYEHITRQIDETLGPDQIGLLMISERHRVQFPQDIEVFYVSPPALDEFHRWLQNWITAQQNAAAQPPDPAGGQEEEDQDTPD
ncbi:MAG: hypothetical protein BZY80_03815 [SAR202 cluster bacterium Io17-Chloro-G2]|nr:MAG: hypothetical protein BZY80_03815 [SAR202 cluster bacterium Io17-Chloro-G2]